jgi:hypothetical protein
VVEPHGDVALDRLFDIAKQGEAGHLGSVAVVIANIPSRIARVTVFGHKRSFKQWVLGVYPSVEYAGRRGIVRRWLCSLSEFGDPIGLLGRRFKRQQRHGLPRATELREVVEHA